MQKSVRSKSNGDARLVQATCQFRAPIIGTNKSVTIPRGTVGVVDDRNGDGYDVSFERGKNGTIPVVATPSQIQFI